MAWMTYAVAYLTAQTEREEGQGLVEYGLIIGLVALACVVALGVLSGNISGMLEGISFT
jgi:pilus assembly protein Flp/PilA